MLTWLDSVTLWYLKRRRARAIARSSDPNIARFYVSRLVMEEHSIRIMGEAPQILELAEQAVALLNAYEATNYVQFDLIPRLEAKIRPLRVTVQWAEGESPGQKALRLEQELARLRQQPIAAKDQSL